MISSFNSLTTNKDKRLNLIHSLGIAYKEDIISNLLVALLNHSKNFKEAFLKNFAGLENVHEYDITAHTRITTRDGIPDIVTVIQNEKECFLMIIENKLKADEGTEQTLRYSSDDSLNDLRNHPKLQIVHSHVKPIFLFLTLVPETIPSGSLFRNISYKELLNTSMMEIEDLGLKMLYEDFCAVLKDFYQDLSISENDLFLQKFSEVTEAERLFIRFRNLITDLGDIPNGLSRTPIGKTGGKGRIGYIIQMKKENWVGHRAMEDEKGRIQLNADTFDIHIECIFDPFNKSFAMPLHYETRPYLPKRILKNKADGYEDYKCKREEIKVAIQQEIKWLHKPLINPYNGSNQIASIMLRLDDDTTVKDFKIQLKGNLKIISEIVDKVLLQVEGPYER